MNELELSNYQVNEQGQLIWKSESTTYTTTIGGVIEWCNQLILTK